MELNELLDATAGTEDARHLLADAFSSWLNRDDQGPLREIAIANGFDVSLGDRLLQWTHQSGLEFHMVLLKDVASFEELTDVINTAHREELLPLLIVQHSDDSTEERGDDVFDLFLSTDKRAIAHAVRVYRGSAE